MRATLTDDGLLIVSTPDAMVHMGSVQANPFRDGGPTPLSEPEHAKPCDVLVLLQRRLEGPDLAALVRLRRNTLVFIPNDDLIRNCLSTLGFTDVRVMRDATGIRLGQTTLLPTHAESRLPSHGCVVASKDGAIWNQGDTGSSAATVAAVKRVVGSVDLVCLTWPPTSMSTAEGDRDLSTVLDTHGRILHGLCVTSPRAVAVCSQQPSEHSKRLHDASWPITKERVIADIGSCGIEAYDVIQGDSVAVQDRTCRYEPADAVVLENRTHCSVFDDARVLPPIPRDNNVFAIDVDLLERTAIDVVTRLLPKWLQTHGQAVEAFARWGVRYQIVVCGPATAHAFQIDLAAKTFEALAGDYRLATIFTYVTASTLYGLYTSQLTWSQAIHTDGYRHRNVVYGVTRGALSIPKYDRLQDPLRQMFADEAIQRRVTEREIERRTRHQVYASPV